MSEQQSQVIGMGRAADGQLGLGSMSSDLQMCLPRAIPSLHQVRVSAMSCGMAHSGLVTTTGTLLMFGKGKYGRLGTANEDDRTIPTVVLVGSDQRVTAISCGAFHTGVVTAKGALYTFGKGDVGQLGHGDCENIAIPRFVSSIHQKVTKISCGVDHTICCTAQGEMYGFGSNAKGQLGIGQTAQDRFELPQRINYHRQGEGEGTVTTYPSSIATGHSFSVIILDGCVYAWGVNDKGQCGTGSLSPSEWIPNLVGFKDSVYATSVSCGLDHTMIVTESGRAYTWGSCEFGQLGMAPELLSAATNNKTVTTPFLVKEALINEQVVSGSCGSYHSVVVTVDGKLFSWGLGDKAQLGKIVEGSGIAPYPYHIRLKLEKQSKDTNMRISVLAAGGRHTLAATYFKPLTSVIPSNFGEDMQRLYTSLTSASPFFDVVIRVQQNSSSFDAHRIILSRVPTLYKILSTSSDLQELSFPSISRQCMSSVLYYIYTNKIPSTSVELPISEMLQLAHDWGLAHLLTLLQGDNYEEGAARAIPRHLKKYVNCQEFSDIAFSATDENGASVKLFAHKAILALRCEYFSVEFLGSFKESAQQVITLSDTSPSAFLQLLTYLYTDEVAFQSDVVDVLTLSNLYQLDHLKTMCEHNIVEEIDIDNAVALYEIAQQYEAKQLFAFCDYFIITQYDKVSKTDDFKVKLLASKQQHFSERHDTLATTKQDSSGENKRCLMQ